MDLSNKYNFYVGTVRGALTCTNLKKDHKLLYSIAPDPTEIKSLTWGRTEDEILVGFKNGHASLYSISQNNFPKTLNQLKGTGPVVGIECVNENIIVARYDGTINIWDSTDNTNENFSLNLDPKGTLECTAYNKNRANLIGTGGEHNDVKLWDVETKQCVFKAKSMGHDELNLPIPTSVRGITFLPESEHLCCCATKEGHVLLYDDRTQRRPVLKFFEKKASFTAIACAYRERQCLVGTTKGYMQLLDMKTGKCLRTFVNMAGSVTSIVVDPLEPYVACTSLDRHLRIYDINTKQLVYKQYMKQSLTKLLMKPIIKDEREEEQQSQKTIDDEYEELFNNMETVTEKKPKRKLTEVVVSENKLNKVRRKKLGSGL